MRLKTNILYYKKGSVIKALKIKELKSKIFSKKQYFTFENSRKQIPTDEMNKSLFFTIKEAINHM